MFKFQEIVSMLSKNKKNLKNHPYILLQCPKRKRKISQMSQYLVLIMLPRVIKPQMLLKPKLPIKPRTPLLSHMLRLKLKLMLSKPKMMTMEKTYKIKKN
jgi:hypothetical protein